MESKLVQKSDQISKKIPMSNPASTTHPLYIIPSKFMKSCKGALYMTQCPKETDIAKFKSVYQCSYLVTIMQTSELTACGLKNIQTIVKKHGISLFLCPIWEEGAPENTEKFNILIEELVKASNAGHNIIIHCRHGNGRTGMAAAAFLIKIGHTKADALSILAECKAGKAAHHLSQQKFLTNYEAFCKTAIAGSKSEPVHK